MISELLPIENYDLSDILVEDFCSRFLSYKSCCGAIWAPDDLSIQPSSYRYPVHLVAISCNWCSSPLYGSYCYHAENIHAEKYCEEFSSISSTDACGSWFTNTTTLTAIASGVCLGLLAASTLLIACTVRAMSDRSLSFLAHKARLHASIDYLGRQLKTRIQTSLQEQIDEWHSTDTSPNKMVLIVRGIKNDMAEKHAQSYPSYAHLMNNTDINHLHCGEIKDINNQDELERHRSKIKALEHQLKETLDLQSTTVDHLELEKSNALDQLSQAGLERQDEGTKGEGWMDSSPKSLASLEDEEGMTNEIIREANGMSRPDIAKLIQEKNVLAMNLKQLREEHLEASASYKALKDRNTWLQRIVDRNEAS